MKKLFYVTLLAFGTLACMPQEAPVTNDALDGIAVNAPQGFTWSNFRTVNVNFTPLTAPMNFSALFTVKTMDGVVLYQALQDVNSGLKVALSLPAQMDRVEITYGSLTVSANANQSDIFFQLPTNNE
ncbi:hypothetical protein A3SI_13193 [Nitritalea halalkaliphila LW7]|uniref:Lipoprotein n=1 Tax=Nitritalea halalkaliphila LW7 TaxID=1189621 RepID=I5C190_9BACT|nr:hypothetical protein [Nitritalea halalkaliphila]EIM75592.1 hypothetical protein A3SI_13193 [Nitritalea halalkaliphila LW7]